MDPQGGLVPTWSYSSLKSFEECAYRVFLSKVERHPEPSSPALDRGSAIHLLAEQYIKGELAEFPPELNKFTSDFEELRSGFADGTVECEEDWAFTIDWAPTDWFGDETWCRQKLDAFVRESDTSAIVIDFKTGKQNSVAHMGQAMQYAVGAFMRYPEIEYIETEFWYLDHGEKMKKNFSRERGMTFLPKIQERAIKMTSAIDFPPDPSKWKCKWCPHAQTETCKWAEV